jgi:hypothetical protein
LDYDLPTYIPNIAGITDVHDHTQLIFLRESQANFLPGLASNLDLSISASCVAGLHVFATIPGPMWIFMNLSYL